MRTQRIDHCWTALALTLAAYGCGAGTPLDEGASTRALALSSPTPNSLPAGERALPLPVGEFDKGFYVPINDLLLGRSNGAQVIANGNVAVSWGDPHVAATLNQAEDALDEFDADLGLQGALTIELSVEAGGDLSGSLRLATIALPPILVAPGIEVSPFAQVNLRLNGSANAGARLSIVAPFEIGAAFSGPGQNDNSVPSPPRFDPEIGLPDFSNALAFDGIVSVEAVAIFLMTVEEFPIGGPVIGSTFGAALRLDQRTWDLDGVTDAVAGWAFPDPVLPKVDHLTHFPFPRTNIASGVTPLADAGSTRWSEAIDVDDDDDAGAIVAVGDGFRLLESGDNGWLASLDTLGATTLQNTETTTVNPQVMVAASNGDLVLCSRSAHALRIERRDRSGNPIWTRTLNVPGASEVDCQTLAPAASNGVLLAGEITHTDGVKRPLLAAIGPDGSVTWSTEVDLGLGSTSPKIHALAETPSGEIIAVGDIVYFDTADHADCTICDQNALVLKLDAGGSPKSAFAIGARGNENASQLALHRDGSYSIGGEDGLGTYRVWLATFTANDVPSWWGSYQSQPDTGSFRNVATLESLASVNGNDLLVAGVTGSGLGIDAWMLRVNRFGMPQWGKQYASADTDDLAQVIALPDGLAAVGTTGFTEATAAYSDLWVIRGNVDGMIHFGSDSGFDAQNTAVQWQRVTDKVQHALAPVALAAALQGDPATPFLTQPASSITVVLSD